MSKSYKLPFALSSTVTTAPFQLIHSDVWGPTCLQYLTTTRPDIQFAVNYVCQCMHAPTENDFQSLTRILRFIKGTLDRGLVFQASDQKLRAYSDSDWANDMTDGRSVTGYSIYLGPNLISWSTEKQQRVSKSSTEAEYRALSSAAS